MCRYYFPYHHLAPYRFIVVWRVFLGEGGLSFRHPFGYLSVLYAFIRFGSQSVVDGGDFEIKIRVYHLGLGFSSLAFLNVLCSASMSIFSLGPSSGISDSFSMLFIHSAFFYDVFVSIFCCKIFYYYSDKPDIKTKEIEVIENRTQTITCEAEGNPDPKVQWIIGNNTFDSSILNISFTRHVRNIVCVATANSPKYGLLKTIQRIRISVKCKWYYFIFYSYIITLGWGTSRIQKQWLVLSIRVMKELPAFII